MHIERFSLVNLSFLISGVPLKGKSVLKNFSLIKNHNLIILDSGVIKNLLELIRVKNEDLNIFKFPVEISKSTFNF